MNPDKVVTRACLLAAVALVVLLVLYGCGGSDKPATIAEQCLADAAQANAQGRQAPICNEATMTIMPVAAGAANAR